MGKEKVVITGAPGTGKTSIINGLEKNGFHCFHEIIRDMTSKAKSEGDATEFVSNPLVFVDDALQFNKDLLHGRAKHFDQSLDIEDPISFFDRGMPDVLAYMDFFGQPYGEEFMEPCRTKRYDHIFIVPPWREIYTEDAERFETFEEAEKIHHYLLDTYAKFGYRPLEVPKDTISNRVAFILKNLNLS